ncbi:MAG TPA: hypothetical protein VIP11_00160 [Gemmatimonadaceae bacterium]
MSLPTRARSCLARLAFSIAAVAAVPHVSPAQRAPSIPDSLSDREFWRIFTSMSEESGRFPSENFVSNERTYQHVIPTLERSLTRNGVYLGVGPEQNFTYIVNLEPRLAVIFDIRRQNAMLHLMYKALFELSPTRSTFLARLFSRPSSRALATSASPAELFDAISTAPAGDSAFGATWKAIVDRLTVTHGFALSSDDIASMRKVLEAFREAGPDISYAYRLGVPPQVTHWLVTYAQLQSATNADSVNMSFLATEESYRKLRVLETRNLIVPIVGDFAGPKAIRSVGEYLKERSATVTAFYTSNVEQYLFNGFGADERFYRNIETLPIDSTSMFIRSLPGSVSIVTTAPLVGMLSATQFNSVRIIDSSGVRIVLAATVDSSGKEVTTRVGTLPAPAPSSASAFTSGIAPIRRTLDAFLSGQLKTYQQLTAMTKIDGWQVRP